MPNPSPFQEEMPEFYREIRFRLQKHPPSWPAAFALLTAYATTGETWSDERNNQANAQLEGRLDGLGVWKWPITGYSPTTGHSEPGWAVEIPFEEACDLGVQFLQDAIYYIQQDDLMVSACAPSKRALVHVARFTARLDGD